MAPRIKLLPPNGRVVSAWGPPPRVPFLVHFLSMSLSMFKPKMTTKMNPKITKNEARNDAKKTTYSKTRNLKFFSEIMALRFLKIDEFLDTVDKLYISRFFAIGRCKPRKHQKSSQKYTPKHTKILQNPRSKKQRILAPILA